jgi:TRAP-type C4-dicarboxylate transport system permease small subunit
MRVLLSTVLRISGTLHTIGGWALTFMMCLTVADVLSRATGHPIMGTYEMVSLSSAIAIGFAIPFTSWERGHIYMEFLLDKFSRRNRDLLNTLTRIICIILFAFIGFNLFQVASDFYSAGEVSITLKIPFFPFAYGVGICCFIECLVFVCDIVKIWEGKYA